MSSTLFLGVDVSKGYADIEALNQADSFLPFLGRFDDTPDGHAAVKAKLLELWDRKQLSELVIGLEATGGLERNWAKFFRNLAPAGLAIKLYLINPLVLKKYLTRHIHRSVTDRHSAQGIAQYLAHGLRPQDRPLAGEDWAGVQTLYRTVRGLINQSVRLQDQFQSLLPRTHPDLVQYCRDGLPQWVLRLVAKYPTARQLARAKPSLVALIPYLGGEARALELVNAAVRSVAAQQDPDSGAAMALLAGETLRTLKTIQLFKARLEKRFEKDRAVQVIDSIIGIGRWSAICLRLELGDVERFPSASAMVAFVGLDPLNHQSGDTQTKGRISHRGCRALRTILYPLTRTAIRCNPVIRGFYERLKANGKKEYVAVVACMRKMLHLIYACWVKDELFDPEYHLRFQQKAREMATRTDRERPLAAPELVAVSLQAPVSRREAKKRKAAIAPQNGVMPHHLMRGLDAAFRRNRNRDECSAQ